MDAARPRPATRHKPILALSLLLLFFLGLHALLPLGTAIQIGGDESFELAKAWMIWITTEHGRFADV
jgi:hypothetical protein